MFESAELGHKTSKAVYDAEVPELREALLNTQFDLLQKGKFSVIILAGGVDGAGKGETVNLLNEWMDPRYIQAHAMGEKLTRSNVILRCGAFGAPCHPKARSAYFLALGTPRPSYSVY